MNAPQPNESIYRFLVAQEGDGDSSSCVSVNAPFRIGRLEGFDLSLPSPNVSALHAEILEEDGELWVYDLGSTNGTYVNDEQVHVKTRLNDDDTIVFGNRAFRLVFSTSSTLSPRQVTATVTNGAMPTSSGETNQERFQRLLDDGAVPFFQPVYEISNKPNRLIGFEVLGRSGISGLRTPEKMFAAAAALSNKMESKLSRVFRWRGIAAAKSNLPKEVKLFVNTHPAELQADDFEDSLHELRDEFPKRPIVLELSEKILAQPNTTAPLRRLLKNIDIGLAIHGFGAGQIHLAELNEIFPNIVKFDRDLTQGIDGAPSKHQRLVRALVRMVKELGITPMAECVESNEEHDTLRQLGFTFAQGFYYGRPNDIEDIELPSQKKAASKITADESKLRPIDIAKQIESESAESVDATPKKKRVGDAAWIMQQSEDRYTIQLMMSPSESSAERFIAKQTTPGEYALYHKPGKTKTWFGVIYGVFNDREGAKAVAEDFKQSGITPLVRRLSGVHIEIQKTQKTV